MPEPKEFLDDPVGPHFHTTLRPENCKSGFSEIMIEHLGNFSFQEMQGAFSAHRAGSFPYIATLLTNKVHMFNKY